MGGKAHCTETIKRKHAAVGNTGFPITVFTASIISHLRIYIKSREDLKVGGNAHCIGSIKRKHAPHGNTGVPITILTAHFPSPCVQIREGVR